MNVRELIEALQQQDPDLPVMLRSPSGLQYVESVDTESKRDCSDPDFDRLVLVIE